MLDSQELQLTSHIQLNISIHIDNLHNNSNNNNNNLSLSLSLSLLPETHCYFPSAEQIFSKEVVVLKSAYKRIYSKGLIVCYISSYRPLISKQEAFRLFFIKI